MPLTRTTQPAYLPVTLAQAKVIVANMQAHHGTA